MSRKFLILFICVTMHFISEAQSKMVFENYNYLGQPGNGSIVPMLHFETSRNWYTELRYNYEDVKTVSLFAGKTFTLGKEKQYEITPLAGLSAGNFNGVSAGLNFDGDINPLFFSAQSQYSKATRTGNESFFFNWSELGYNFSDRFFGGLAVQLTMQEELNDVQPGLFVGISFRNISLPVYVFSPFSSGKYFILGIYYEYNLKRKSLPAR